MSESVLISADVRRALFIRQIIFLFAIAASVAIGVYVVLWSQKPNYSMLYGSLSDQDASQVLESLQKSNIEYHVDPNSGAVMVATAKVHEARMSLASEGLPRSSNSGFSILSEEQKLGTSQFMEKARYQHALENELALSIRQIKAVKAARVHLAVPKESVFLRNRKAASASVLLDLYPGHRLEVGQVAAIANLVASSVPSLELSKVSIVDQHGHLMSQNQSSADLAVTASQFQYASQVENSYIKRIENILIPLLGPDGIKAQVTAEMDFTSTEQTRESYNPDMLALRSEQLEEDSSSSSNIAGGVPGALSNQPALDGNAPEIVSENESDESQSGSGSMQRRSTRNYELDKTISHTRLAAGNLLRLSVAVVIDYKKSLDDEGEIIRVEHTPEELEQITNLVKETIGFNVLRGDSVNVMNSKFSLPAAVEPLPEVPVWQQAWVWDIAKQVLGGLFVLFLVFGILKPAIKNMMNKEITLHQTALTGPGGGSGVAGQLTAGNESLPASEMKALESAPEYDKSITNVKEMVNTDPKLAAQVVRNWVGEE